MHNPIRKLLDPVEMLSGDHESVKALFEKCAQTQPGLTRKLLATEIFKNLTIHATLEEEIFYPAVRQYFGQEGLDFVLVASHEHRQMKGLIRELEQSGQGEVGFLEKLQTLQQHVLEHAEKEETKIFPQADAKLPLRDLAVAMTSAVFN